MSGDDDPFQLIRGKVSSLYLCSDSEEVSMFVLACGRLAVHVSFLAQVDDTDTYLLSLHGREEARVSSINLVYHCLNSESL